MGTNLVHQGGRAFAVTASSLNCAQNFNQKTELFICLKKFESLPFLVLKSSSSRDPVRSDEFCEKERPEALFLQ